MSDQRIRRIAREHQPALREIALRCGAGTDCGGCRAAIREILAEERERGSAAAEPAALASSTEAPL